MPLPLLKWLGAAGEPVQVKVDVGSISKCVSPLQIWLEALTLPC
jgi:hypothetical protein